MAYEADRWVVLTGCRLPFLGSMMIRDCVYRVCHSPVRQIVVRTVITPAPSALSSSWIDALEDHEGTVSIGSRAITSLHFADDIDGLAEEEEELAKLFERLDKADKAYGMEISAEKTKLMTTPTASTKKSK